MKLEGVNREVAAEFLGTFVLMAFGLGVNAQVLLGKSNAGDFFSINIGWGLGVAFGIYVAGSVSGAHMNPAVTLALAVFRRFSWKKVLPYFGGQFLGAFVAAAVIYGVYHEGIAAYDGGTRQILGDLGTAGIFGTYPNSYLSTLGGLVDQIFGTALLCMMVFALADNVNQHNPGLKIGPLVVGAVVMAIGMAVGLNAGYAINPARDFSPRLFTALAGWGWDVFRVYDYWWWVPIVGPCIGGVVGGAAYELLVCRHHPPAHNEETSLS